MSLVVVGALLAVVLVGALCFYCMLGRVRANRRAAHLVRGLLTPKEVHLLESRGYLDVASPSTPDRVYRIPACPGTVAVMDRGVISAWLCAQPVRSLPAAEHVLVHKLLLEGAEAEYWLCANRLRSHFLTWPESETDQVMLWTGRPPGVLGLR